MLDLLKPSMFVLFSWMGLFFIFGGVGLLGMRAVARIAQLETAWTFGRRLFLAFWLGWALILAVLQIWHIFLPVDWIALSVVWVLGLAGLIVHWRDLWALLKTEWRERKRVWLVAGAVVLWLSNLALGPLTNYDDGLYRLQSMLWAKSYPIVPGLGNLHGRLAFNSSYSLYAAMLDAGEWAGRAYHLAGGLLAAVLAAYSIRSLAALFSAREPDRPYRLFHALLLAPIVIEASTGYISSLSPALPVFVVAVVMVGQLLLFLLESGQMNAVQERLLLVWFAAVGSAGLTVERTSFSLFVTVLLVALAVWLAKRRKGARRELLAALSWMAGVIALLVAPWMARGVILSGYPVYPSTLGAFNVPWRVPTALAAAEANWFRSWPRTPNVFWSEVLGNWNWLRGWAEGLSPDVFRAVGITLASALLALFAPRSADQKGKDRLLWLALLPSVVMLLFWFNSAPNPRFAGGALWSLAAGAATLTLVRFLPDERGPQPLLAVALIGFFLILSPLRAPFVVGPGADGGFHALASTPYKSTVTAGGFVVYLPQQGDRCGLAPLPCTPYYRPNLHAVLAFGSRYGYMLDDSVTYLDIHGTKAPADPNVSPGLSVLYQSGWYDPDPGTGVRWMSSPSRILIYTEKPATARMVLTPIKMHTWGNFGDVGRLRVLLNGRTVDEFIVRKDLTAEVSLRLSRDFNTVTLQFLGGNFVPKEAVPGNTDERSLAIGFQPIQIRTVP